MMPNRHATWRDEYITMIDDCKKRSEILTDWERSFVDSLRQAMVGGRHPSAKQIERLDNIWGRVTAYRPQIAATEVNYPALKGEACGG